MVLFWLSADIGVKASTSFQVAGREMLKYEIPAEFAGIHRYLTNADQTDEFSQTCPDPGEIVWTYGGRKPRPKK